MYHANHVNRQNVNSPEKSSSTTIRRMVVEHGVRPVENNNNNSSSNGQSATSTAISTINKQHADDQLELQELNTKLSTYLDHVQRLETRNANLLINLEDLKQAWGGDAKQIHATYGPKLESLRNAIDNSLHDKIQPELELKRYEYDIWQAQQLIATLDVRNTHQLAALEQELNMILQELEQLKNQFDRRSQDLIQQRTNLENFVNELDGIQTELVNHRLERIIVENELQTITEQIAFENAIYQAQREELLSLTIPVLDTSTFYRNELARAISDIRQDFDVLAQSQLHELEEYYRVKTEHVQQEIAQENERKRLVNSENETLDRTTTAATLKDHMKDYQQLQNDHEQLQKQFDDITDDLARIQEENIREKTIRDRELNQLSEELAVKQEAIDNILGNNVSLRFELSTYGRLLNSEEQRLDRLEQGQQVSSSPLTSSPSSNKRPSISTQSNTNFSVQKMAIKKSSQGPLIFDSVDFINDSILVKYDKSTGNEQSLGDWSIIHENDKQPPRIYKFPSSFVLRPRQTVRIFAKRSAQSAKSSTDALIADQIDTWGQGQVMITRLINSNNEEKASITQTRVSS